MKRTAVIPQQASALVTSDQSAVLELQAQVQSSGNFSFVLVLQEYSRKNLFMSYLGFKNDLLQHFFPLPLSMTYFKLSREKNEEK